MKGTAIRRLQIVFTAALFCFGAARAGAQSIVLSATGAAGETGTLTATLTTGGASIAGTQNDIAFPASGPIADLDGSPDCTVNRAINKGGTSFAFLPAGCSGSACTGVRALVLALNNVNPIPDNSVLYTCNLSIAASASGTLTYANSNVVLSDPAGAKVTPATGVDATLNLPGGACPDPRPAPAGPGIWIPDQTLAGGATTATISVTLAAGGAEIAGTQNDLTFPSGGVIPTVDGSPDCAVNPDIKKGGTSFAFLPPGCSGSACTGMRALVLALNNVTAIPDGSVLYTCNVTLSGATTTWTPENVVLSDPSGAKVTATGNQDGILCVSSGEATATPTATEIPTEAPPTLTPTEVAPTETPTLAPPSIVEDEGGCQIGAAGHGSSGWLLLVPMVGLLALRRRGR
jgi:hypothetical protein